MFLDRILGQLFDALADHANGWRGRSCVLSLLVVVVALLPLTEGDPPDPLWTGGIYDPADYDDIAASVSSGATAPARSPTSPFLILVGVILPAGALSPAAAPLPVFPIRGPPLWGRCVEYRVTCRDQRGTRREEAR